MRRTEEELWKFTPRKLQALLKVHYDVIKQKKDTQTPTTSFIDNIPGW